MTALLSLERKKRPGDESHHKDKGGRLRPTRTRRRRAPVDATGRRREYTRSSSGERAAHISYLKANPNQAATHKVTLDAKDSRKQGPPTQDPVQHDLVDPSTSYK